jgi:hypothetical protein
MQGRFSSGTFKSHVDSYGNTIAVTSSNIDGTPAEVQQGETGAKPDRTSL